MHYVYFLQSERDKGFYIGYTKDLQKRLSQHNDGLVISTKNRKPFRIIYYESYLAEGDARTRERRLKQFKNSYKELMKRINGSLQA